MLEQRNVMTFPARSPHAALAPSNLLTRMRRSVSARLLTAAAALGVSVAIAAPVQGWFNFSLDKPASSPSTSPVSLPATSNGSEPETDGGAKAAAQHHDSDNWYTLMMMGKKAGYLHSVCKREGNLITTTSKMLLAIKREAIRIEIGVDTVFVETVDGKPVSMKATKKLGALPVTEEVTFGDGHATLSVSQAGTKNEDSKPKTKPLPKESFFPPAAAEREMRRQRALGQDKVVVRTIDPSEALSFITITREYKGTENVKVMGKVVRALRASSTMDKYPGLTTEEYLDDRGELVRTVVNMGGIQMEQLLADRELALLEKDAPELLVSTTIKLDKPIDKPRELQSGKFVLTVTDGELSTLPSVGYQSFERVGPGAGRVVVDLARTGSAPTEAELADPSFMEASTMVNWRDVEVAKLTKRALPAPTASDPERAEKLRQFVSKIIDQKDMSVGFASASETARTLTGDCTEHAVLLAALLRGSGIPSRVCSGLVYVESFGGEKNVFGYHMWAQALLNTPQGKRWVDLDAAIGGPRAFDATHITLGTSALADGQTENYLVTMAPLIGRLVIKADR